MAKPIWDKENPKKSSKKMTTSEKASATKSAKQQGRSSPSLVDNINAQKKKNSKSKKSKKTKKQR